MPARPSERRPGNGSRTRWRALRPACVVPALLTVSAAATHPPALVLGSSGADPPPSTALVLESLKEAYGGLLLLIGTTGDELVSTGTVPELDVYDGGDISDPTTTLLADVHTSLVEAIWAADDLLGLLEAAGSTDYCLMAEAHSYRGMAHLFAGEFYGEWPSGVPLDPPLTGDALIQLLTDDAISDFDQALAFEGAGACTDPGTPIGSYPGDARLVTALRARAHAHAGDFASAMASAAAVPGGGWSYGFSFTAGLPSRVQAAITGGDVSFGADYSAGVGGLTGLLDPVDGVIRPRSATFRADLLAAGPLLLPVISGAELTLIVAESELAADDLAAFIGEINTLRAADGLSLRPVPTTAPEAAVVLREERREYLFARGHRLRDQYEGSEPAPEWTPGSDADATPGSFLPLPATACVGPCPDRVAVTGRTNAEDGVVVVAGRRAAAGFDECFELEGALEVGGEATLAYNALAPDPCGSALTVYEWGDRLVYQPSTPGWTAVSGDMVSVASGAPLELPIQVWRRSYADVPGSEIQADIDSAAETFLRNRVGVIPTHEVDSAAGIPDVLRCDMRDALRAAGAFTPGLLNVYYVSTIQTLEAGVWVDRLGLFCPDPTPGPTVMEDTTFVLIDRDLRWTTTLAHELGHALVRNPPAVAHPRVVFGTVVPQSNLMSTYSMTTKEGDVVLRDSLSLGQAFRMNVHAGSWLNRAVEVDSGFVPTGTPVRADPAVYCPCNVVEPGPCPPLGLHFDGSLAVRPHGAPSDDRYFQLQCLDRFLVTVPGTVVGPDDAALLVDGRSDALGGCFDDVAARSYAFGGGPFYHSLEFENLLDPGPLSCPAEFLFFSRNHRFLRSAYAASDFGGLTEGAQEQFEITSLLDAPVDVPVRVWTTSTTAGDCIAFEGAGLADTAAALFRENRTGVALSFVCSDAMLFTGVSGAACTPTGITSGTVNVLWVDSLPGAVTTPDATGAVCPGGEVVYLRAGAGSSVTALAHHLGHVVGLDHVAVGAVGFTALARARNLMAPGSVADEALRDRFTLGQVVRMYNAGGSLLRTRLGLPILCPGATCPEIPVDVER